MRSSRDINWIQELNYVTLKQRRDPDFSICDEVFEPFELIYVAFLLSSAEFHPLDTGSSGSNATNETASQRKLKQKIAEYNKECAKTLKTTVAMKALENTSKSPDVSASLLLENVIRNIIIRYPTVAYDAIMVLNEMQQNNKASNQYTDEDMMGQQIKQIDRKYDDKGWFLEFCLMVIYPLSLSSSYSGSGDEWEKVNPQYRSAEHCNIPDVLDIGQWKDLEQQSEDCMKTKVHRKIRQDALLKVLLAADDITTVAEFLLRWNRIDDLKIFSTRVWDSVRFLLGEKENEEEYYSAQSVWGDSRGSISSGHNQYQHRSINGDSRIRRPLPMTENILEVIQSDEENNVEDNDDVLGCNDDSVYSDNNRAKDVAQFKTDSTNTPSNKIIANENQNQNHIPVESDPSFSQTKKDNIDVPSFLPKINPHPRTLDPNSSELLRNRLKSAAIIQKICCVFSEKNENDENSEEKLQFL